MLNYPQVTVIIVNFNGRRFLERCLASLASLNYPKDRLEVILGDNSSTDDSVAFTQARFPWVRIVRFEKNLGFCRPNNDCAGLAQGEYLVFLNNDTYVERDWLLNLVDGALSNPRVVSCASKILFAQYENEKVVNAAGGVIFPGGGGLYGGYWDTDTGQSEYNTQCTTGFGCGAGVLYEKKFFQDVGGFDPYYFYSIEEQDLGLRAWLCGREVLYVPSAVMYHYMGQTGFRGRGVTPSIEFLQTRNKLHFIVKNFQIPTALKGLCFFAAYTLYKVIYSARHRNLKIPAAIANGYFFFMRDIAKSLRARTECQRSRKVPDRVLVQKKVLVGLRESARRLKESRRWMLMRRPGPLFDTGDTFRVRVDHDGDMIFYRT